MRVFLAVFLAAAMSFDASADGPGSSRQPGSSGYKPNVAVSPGTARGQRAYNAITSRPVDGIQEIESPFRTAGAAAGKADASKLKMNAKNLGEKEISSRAKSALSKWSKSRGGLKAKNKDQEAEFTRGYAEAFAAAISQ